MIIKTNTVVSQVFKKGVYKAVQQRALIRPNDAFVSKDKLARKYLQIFWQQRWNMSFDVFICVCFCRRKHDWRLVSAGSTWMQHDQTRQTTFYQVFHPQTRPDGRVYLFVLVFFAVFVHWCLLVGAVPLRADTIASISANFWRFLFVALRHGVRPRRRPAVITSTRQKLLHSTR